MTTQQELDEEHKREQERSHTTKSAEAVPGKTRREIHNGFNLYKEDANKFISSGKDLRSPEGQNFLSQHKQIVASLDREHPPHLKQGVLGTMISIYKFFQKKGEDSFANETQKIIDDMKPNSSNGEYNVTKEMQSFSKNNESEFSPSSLQK